MGKGFGKMREIHCKGRVIGGIKPNICVPVMGQDLVGLLTEANEAISFQPDLLEWRADYFHNVGRADFVLETLDKLLEVIGNCPLIFTCRAFAEGGCSEMAHESRVALIKAVIKTRKADFIDIELETGTDTVGEIVKLARDNGIYTIISNHNFEHTPAKEEMIRTLIREQEAGADMAKIAVMPKCRQDVLNLLEATLFFKQEHATIPAATIAMSGIGTITRTAGFLFGSAVTFAAIKNQSAPGQLHITKLRTSTEILLQSL